MSQELCSRPDRFFDV